MSYFDDASLVMIPSGYKDQKVYSVKPLDGSGDLTFSRASSATRVASNGLIEKVRTNLALYSQDFSDATWYKELGNSATANTIANPLDGVVNADTITATATNAINVNQLFTAAATSEYTYSIYLKKNNHDFIQPYIFSGGGFAARIEINLTDGTFTTINGSGATVTSVGNGWYRATLIASLSSSATFTTGVLTLSTTGSRSVYVFGAQLETGVATAYIATTSAAVSVGPVSGLPRLDYLNSTCPRLLLEPQRTNSQIKSENFASWLGIDNVTISSNTTDTLDPSGYNGSDKITLLGGAPMRVYEFTGSSAGTGTISLFVKAGTTPTIALFTSSSSLLVNFNLSTQVVTPTTGTGTITSYGNGWYRITATATLGSNEVLQILFVGSAGQTMYIWGAQVEAGAYATSYIPTLGTSVTRVADAALTGSVPSLIGQTAGTIFWQGSVDYRQSGDGHALALSGSASSFGDAMLLYRQSSNGHLAIYIQIGGVNQFGTPLTYNDTASVSENDKYAIAYANNDLVVYKNGVQIISASSGSIPACNYFLLNEWNNTYVNTNITKQAILFPTRLSNSDLAALTA